MCELTHSSDGKGRLTFVRRRIHDGRHQKFLEVLVSHQKKIVFTQAGSRNCDISTEIGKKKYCNIFASSIWLTLCCLKLRELLIIAGKYISLLRSYKKRKTLFINHKYVIVSQCELEYNRKV